jgi:hypothetical protein
MQRRAHLYGNVLQPKVGLRSKLDTPLTAEARLLLEFSASLSCFVEAVLGVLRCDAGRLA